MSQEVVMQRERFVDVIAEMMPLLEKHWREIAHFQDIPLEVDRVAYEQLCNMGMLRIYTMRKHTALIGYAVYFVRSNPHYKSSIQASQDVIFVDPEHRGVGRKLIQFADEQLQIEGVQAVYHHVKAAHNFGPLLESMGYSLVDLIYTKRLD